MLQVSMSSAAVQLQQLHESGDDSCFSFVRRYDRHVCICAVGCDFDPKPLVSVGVPSEVKNIPSTKAHTPIWVLLKRVPAECPCRLFWCPFQKGRSTILSNSMCVRVRFLRCPPPTKMEAKTKRSFGLPTGSL